MSAQHPQLLTADPPREPYVSDARIWGWFFFLSSLFWPRVVILTFWIFGSTIGRAFDHSVVPVIGFFVHVDDDDVRLHVVDLLRPRLSGWEWICVGVAVLFDLWTWAGGRELFRH